MERIAVVSGGSGGIGRECCRQLAQKGFTVYEISRSGTDTDFSRHITADVSDPEQVETAFGILSERHHHLELLVNNAGMGISGPVELTSAQKAQIIFSVNFFGQLYCAQRAIPLLRQGVSPRIVCVSSVAAPIAIPFQAFYSATKAAVNSLALCLANELREFGISVCTVMPGDAHTGFTSAREKCADEQELYGERARRAVASMEKDELSGMTPEQVARVIVKAACAKHPRSMYVAGAKYKLLLFIYRILPIGIANRLVNSFYK